MYGDPAEGGLDKATFLKRQGLYRWGEQESMKDTSHFIAKAWEIYRCKDFINDASGSLCEIVDLDDPEDPVIKGLREETLILYIRAGRKDEEALMERAESDPKPLFYYPSFIEDHLDGQPNDGRGVGPKDFARKLFPDLLEDRKPRYARMAEKYGFTIDVADLFAGAPAGQVMPDTDTILSHILDTIRSQSADNEVATANANHYVNACLARAERRALDI